MFLRDGCLFSGLAVFLISFPSLPRAGEFFPLGCVSHFTWDDGFFPGFFFVCFGSHTYPQSVLISFRGFAGSNFRVFANFTSLLFDRDGGFLFRQCLRLFQCRTGVRAVCPPPAEWKTYRYVTLKALSIISSEVLALPNGLSPGIAIIGYP